MRRLRLGFFIGAIIGVISLAGCKNGSGVGGNGGADPNVIRVGEYGSMTGRDSTFGESTHEGIQLAVDELNGAGGISGKRVGVFTEDTQSESSKAQTAVKRLLSKNVVAVLGEVASSSSMTGGEVCQQNEIPMISPSSTKPSVTEIGDYIFRVCFIDPFQAGVVAKFAYDTLKARTAAVFYDSAQTYSVGFRDDFKKSFQSRGGQIVQEASYSGDDKDFKAALTRIQAAQPDVILVPGYYTQSGSIVKQARDLGITVPILGGDGWDSRKFFEYAGRDVENCYFSNHMAVDDPNPTIQNFVKTYQSKFGHAPDALAALGYDAARLLFQAMKSAKSLSGPDLRDAIAQTRDFDGVTGRISINAQRNADKPAVILEITGGRFKLKERIASL